MSVYDKDGNILQTVYDKSGQSLTAAYSADGSQIFPDGPISLRVCTYNVGGWYIGSGTNVPADKDAAFYALQNGILSDINADILCIEEYWSVFSKTNRTAESLLSQYYPYIRSAGGTTTYYGRAICSKYPITSYVSHYYTNETSRYYDVATINVSGTTVYVVVTHLSANNIPNRIAQAVELYNFIVAQGWEKYMVFGDFNSPLHDPFSEQNTGVYQQFLDDGCKIANAGAFGILNTACNSADWATEAFAIDNIICSDGITIESVATNLTKTTDANVLATGKIDHIPLYADIEL